MRPESWLALAAVSALLAVAFGAFGAHGLEGRVPAERLATFETGARYHMYHALGLGLVALAAMVRPQLAIDGPAVALVFGMAVFSGSLYVLTLTGMKWLGAITPIGGTAMLVGWGWFALRLLSVK